ncbi:MAG: hypothetical protein CME06_03720 [Gemmatimonadetes bacterium]|nr:hypothetical protein [Gemmatimonadota bacterium]
MTSPLALPAPLSVLQMRLAAAETNTLRRDRAATLFESILRFATLVTTARYLQIAGRIQGQGGIAANEARVADVGELLGRGTLGAWLDLMHGSLEYLRAHNDELLIPGIHGFYFGSRKPDRDAVARAHDTLALAIGGEAPATHTLERMARFYADRRAEKPDLAPYLHEVDENLVADALTEAIEQLCAEIVALVPCIPAIMVGHEEHPRRAWLRPLPRSGQPSDKLIEIRVAEADELAPPGHLMLTWTAGDYSILLDLHPFAIVRDSHIHFLDHGIDGGARYASPVLGITDGDQPLSTKTDLLGRYRIVELLGARKAHAIDLESGSELELSLARHGSGSREERSKAIRVLRDRMRALAPIPGLRCSSEILEVGQWVASVRPWAQGRPFLDWVESGRRNAIEVAGIVERVARTVRDMHAVGHQHGRLTDKRVVIDDDGASVVLVSGLPPRPGWDSDHRSILEILASAIPAEADGRFGRLRALAQKPRTTEDDSESRGPPSGIDELIDELGAALEKWEAEDLSPTAPTGRRESRWWRRTWAKLRRGP